MHRPWARHSIVPMISSGPITTSGSGLCSPRSTEEEIKTEVPELTLHPQRPLALSSHPYSSELFHHSFPSHHLAPPPASCYAALTWSSGQPSGELPLTVWGFFCVSGVGEFLSVVPIPMSAYWWVGRHSRMRGPEAIWENDQPFYIWISWDPKTSGNKVL